MVTPRLPNSCASVLLPPRRLSRTTLSRTILSRLLNDRGPDTGHSVAENLLPFLGRKELSGLSVLVLRLAPIWLLLRRLLGLFSIAFLFGWLPVVRYLVSVAAGALTGSTLAGMRAFSSPGRTASVSFARRASSSSSRPVSRYGLLQHNVLLLLGNPDLRGPMNLCNLASHLTTTGLFDATGFLLGQLGFLSMPGFDFQWSSFFLPVVLLLSEAHLLLPPTLVPLEAPLCFFPLPLLLLALLDISHTGPCLFLEPLLFFLSLLLQPPKFPSPLLLGVAGHPPLLSLYIVLALKPGGLLGDGPIIGRRVAFPTVRLRHEDECG
ncbi:hypothetical protein VTI74DRAFT_11077 [Chaetomium olivicolor]